MAELHAGNSFCLLRTLLKTPGKQEGWCSLPTRKGQQSRDTQAKALVKVGLGAFVEKEGRVLSTFQRFVQHPPPQLPLVLGHNHQCRTDLKRSHEEQERWG